MRLLVDRIDTAASTHSYEVAANWWIQRVEASGVFLGRALEPFRFEIEAYRGSGDDLHLTGTFSGTLELECGRCLARYRHALRDAFRLVLEPAGERLPPDPEGAAALTREGLCLGEELEVGWYRGNEIELDALFAELISLALPIQPRCRKECAGLCPVCGVDRNGTQCDCVESKVNSPFAALAALRDGERGGRAE